MIKRTCQFSVIVTIILTQIYVSTMTGILRNEKFPKNPTHFRFGQNVSMKGSVSTFSRFFELSGSQFERLKRNVSESWTETESNKKERKVARTATRTKE